MDLGPASLVPLFPSPFPLGLIQSICDDYDYDYLPWRPMIHHTAFQGKLRAMSVRMPPACGVDLFGVYVTREECWGPAPCGWSTV